jgi:hypothetical protein
MISGAIDMDLCRKGIAAKLEASRKTTPMVVLQTAANITGRAMAKLPPENADTKRLEIQLYLKQALSTRFKQATSGKRKGLFIKKGARNNQLQRAHLILQARRRAEGKPGLYGAQMRTEAGKFKQRSSVSVGFARSVYIPIAAALNELVPYKIPLGRLARHISRWPGSAGYGQVTLPQEGDVVTVVLQIGANVKRATNEERLLEIEQRALQAAADEEGLEASRWAAEMLAKATDAA